PLPGGSTRRFSGTRYVLGYTQTSALCTNPKHIHTPPPLVNTLHPRPEEHEDQQFREKDGGGDIDGSDKRPEGDARLLLGTSGKELVGIGKVCRVRDRRDSFAHCESIVRRFWLTTG